MSYAPATWPAIAAWLLVAAMKLTVSPWALNRFWSSAMKKPAESTGPFTERYAPLHFGARVPGQSQSFPYHAGSIKAGSIKQENRAHQVNCR